MDIELTFRGRTVTNRFVCGLIYLILCLLYGIVICLSFPVIVSIAFVSELWELCGGKPLINVEEQSKTIEAENNLED